MYDYNVSLLDNVTNVSSETKTTITLSSLLIIISMWKIFKKANKPGWASIIPIYNIIVLYQVAGVSMWFLLLMFIPFVNIYVLFKTYIELAHRFNKSTGFGVLSVFFNVVCMPILAFSNATYNEK
jgi:hypothetical protein